MTDQQPSKGQAPSHEIFFVREGKEDKNYWQKVGAAWQHQSGEGFNIQMELMPVATGRLVMLKRKPKDEAK